MADFLLNFFHVIADIIIYLFEKNHFNASFLGLELKTIFSEKYTGSLQLLVF